MQEINVAVGIKKENNIIDISKFSTNKKKELIDKLNYYYSIKYVKAIKVEGEPIINLLYNSEEELNDINNWFTLKELEDGNIITIKEK